MTPTSILIVEDDEGVRNSLQALFTFAEIPAFWAENAAKALSLLDGVFLPQMMLPEVCLVDARLPDMCGIELSKTLRAKLGELPQIYLMSANPFLSESAEKLHHVTGWISKPFEVESMIRFLKNPSTVRLDCKK